MCCIITSFLKCAVTLVNAIIGVAFLLLALAGVLLKSSNSFVQKIVSAVLAKAESNATNAEVQELVQFVMENTTSIAAIFIVTGLVCAALCFVGCFAGCCGCACVLKIYAVMLGVLMVIKIIAISVVFASERLSTDFIVFAMDKLLEVYGQGNKKATVLWDLCMTVGEPCCGMDKPEDFKTYPTLPAPCCGGATGCTATSDTIVKTPCRPKIIKFTMENMHIVLFISIAAVLLEGALLILTVTAIWLKAISPV